MTHEVNEEHIPYTQMEYVITCGDCHMQFILNTAFINENGEFTTMHQVKIDFCPYCGKDQRT